MNPDDFEKRLQRLPLRELPSEWREKILRGAAPAPRSFLSTLNHHLSTLLWPHPKAWAGLAAVWIAIAALHFAGGDRMEQVAKKTAPPSAEAVVMLRQQNQLFAKMFGPPVARDADRPKSLSPRSDRRRETLVA